MPTTNYLDEVVPFTEAELVQAFRLDQTEEQARDTAGQLAITVREARAGIGLSPSGERGDELEELFWIMPDETLALLSLVSDELNARVEEVNAARWEALRQKEVEHRMAEAELPPMLIRALLLIGLVLVAQPGHPQQQSASDSAIIVAAAAIVRNADACAAVWPGYWHRGKAFGFSRQTDSSVYVHLPEPPGSPYRLVREHGAPGGLYRRREYPDGFGGIDLNYRVGGLSFPVVHAYTSVQHHIIELLYHEGFHGHQWTHFMEVAGGRPAFGSNLAPVALETTQEEFERLASAERVALDAALGAEPAAQRDILREYLALRRQRAAMSPSVQAVERHEEQMEGTAEYVGQRCTGLATASAPDWARARIRAQLGGARPALLNGRPSKWRAYGVGAALAILLDDLGAEDWRAQVTAGEPLDALLQRALEGNAQQ